MITLAEEEVTPALTPLAHYISTTCNFPRTACLGPYCPLPAAAFLLLPQNLSCCPTSDFHLPLLPSAARGKCQTIYSLGSAQLPRAIILINNLVSASALLIVDWCRVEEESC